MPRNLELKARIASLDAAREVALRIATSRLSDQRQTDTYFSCTSGRLKLREIDGAQAQLVWYRRPDGYDVRASDYVLAPAIDGESLKAALAGALSVQCVVAKRREIFLFHNVRIHLDRVEGLGEFLEFEAVLGPDADEATSQQRLHALRAQFRIQDADLVPGSYRELMLAATDGVTRAE